MLNMSRLVLAASTGLLFPSIGHAVSSTYTAQTTANMNVNLTILKSCQLTAGDMNFGEKYSNAGDIHSQATTMITCTKNTPYKLSSDASHHYEMVDSEGNKVAYSLYTDSGQRSQLTAGTTGTGTGSAESVTIYGTVASAALASAPAGVYRDTVTLQVGY